MTKITLYGLTNCDTCRKARHTLETLAINYSFVDLRKDACDEQGHLDHALADNFFAHADWQILINRRSTTWRQIPTEQRENLDRYSAQALAITYPTILKRPLLEYDDKLIVGYDEDTYQRFK